MNCNSMKSIKVITIGEAGVGKTALTMRYANNTFGLHEMTIGVDFAIKHMNDGGKMQIWDTAGQEVRRSASERVRSAVARGRMAARARRRG